MTYSRTTMYVFKCDGPKCKEKVEVKRSSDRMYGRPDTPKGWIDAVIGLDSSDRHFHNSQCLKDYADDKDKKKKAAADRRKTARASGGRRKSTRKTSRRTTRKRAGSGF